MKVHEAAVILGVHPDTHVDTLKQAYRRLLVLAWHPDKSQDSDAKENFQRISIAYTKLISAPFIGNKRQDNDDIDDQSSSKKCAGTHGVDASLPEFINFMTKDRSPSQVDKNLRIGAPLGVMFESRPKAPESVNCSTEDETEINCGAEYEREDHGDDNDNYDDDDDDDDDDDSNESDCDNGIIPSMSEEQNYSQIDLKVPVRKDNKAGGQKQGIFSDTHDACNDKVTARRKIKNAKKRLHRRLKIREKKLQATVADGKINLCEETRKHSERQNALRMEKQLNQEIEFKMKEVKRLFSLISSGNIMKVKSFLSDEFDDEKINHKNGNLSTLFMDKNNLMLSSSSLFYSIEKRKLFIDDIILFEPLLHSCVQKSAKFPRSYFYRIDENNDIDDNDSKNPEHRSNNRNNLDKNENAKKSKSIDFKSKNRREQGRLQVAKYLLDLRFPSLDLDLIDHDGLTVLHVASKIGDTKILKLLLNNTYRSTFNDANNDNHKIKHSINIISNDYCSIINSYAYSYSNSNNESINCSDKHHESDDANNDSNNSSKNDDNNCNNDNDHYNSNVNDDNNRRAPRQLNIDSQCLKLGWTALHYAAIQGDLISLKLLIEAGASVSVNSGTTHSFGSSTSSGIRTNADDIFHFKNDDEHGPGTLPEVMKGLTPLELVTLRLQNSNQFSATYISNLKLVANELSDVQGLIKKDTYKKEISDSIIERKLLGRSMENEENANEKDIELLDKTALMKKTDLDNKKSLSTNDGLGKNTQEDSKTAVSLELFPDRGPGSTSLEPISLGCTSLGFTNLESTFSRTASPALTSLGSDKQVRSFEISQIPTSNISANAISSIAVCVSSVVSAVICKSGEILSKALKKKKRKQMKSKHESIILSNTIIPSLDDTFFLSPPPSISANPLPLHSNVMLGSYISSKSNTNNNHSNHSHNKKSSKNKNFTTISPSHCEKNEEKTIFSQTGRSLRAENVPSEIKFTFYSETLKVNNTMKVTDFPLKKNHKNLGSGSRSGSLGSYASTVSTTNSTLSRTSDVSYLKSNEEKEKDKIKEGKNENEENVKRNTIEPSRNDLCFKTDSAKIDQSCNTAMIDIDEEEKKTVDGGTHDIQNDGQGERHHEHQDETNRQNQIKGTKQQEVQQEYQQLQRKHLHRPISKSQHAHPHQQMHKLQGSLHPGLSETERNVQSDVQHVQNQEIMSLQAAQTSPEGILERGRSTISKLFQNVDISSQQTDVPIINILQPFPDLSNSRSSSSTSSCHFPFGSMISSLSISRSVSESESRSESGIYSTHYRKTSSLQHDDKLLLGNGMKRVGLDATLESRLQSRLGSLLEPVGSSEIGSGSSSGTGSETGSKSGRGSEIGSGTGSKSWRGSGTGFRSETGSVSRLGARTGSISEPEPVSRLGARTGSISEPEPVSRLGARTGSISEPEPVSYKSSTYHDTGVEYIKRDSIGVEMENDIQVRRSRDTSSPILDSPVVSVPSMNHSLVFGFDIIDQNDQEETCLNLPKSLLESYSFDVDEKKESFSIGIPIFEEFTSPSGRASTVYDMSSPLSRQFISMPQSSNLGIILGTIQSPTLRWNDTDQILGLNKSPLPAINPTGDRNADSYSQSEFNSLLISPTQTHNGQRQCININPSDSPTQFSPNRNQQCNSKLSPDSTSYTHFTANSPSGPGPNFSPENSPYQSIQESQRICQQIFDLEQQLHANESFRLRYQLKQYQYTHNNYNRLNGYDYDYGNNSTEGIIDVSDDNENKSLHQLSSNTKPFVPLYRNSRPLPFSPPNHQELHRPPFLNPSKSGSNIHNSQYSPPLPPSHFHLQYQQSGMRSNHTRNRFHQTHRHHGNHIDRMDQSQSQCLYYIDRMDQSESQSLCQSQFPFQNGMTASNNLIRPCNMSTSLQKNGTCFWGTQSMQSQSSSQTPTQPQMTTAREDLPGVRGRIIDKFRDGHSMTSPQLPYAISNHHHHQNRNRTSTSTPRQHAGHSSRAFPHQYSHVRSQFSSFPSKAKSPYSPALYSSQQNENRSSLSDSSEGKSHSQLQYNEGRGSSSFHQSNPTLPYTAHP